MPQTDGIETLKEIRTFLSKPGVVILSIHEGVALIHQSLEYVLKQSISEELIDAVRAAVEAACI